MSAGLKRIAQRAKADPGWWFTALAHHLTEEFFRETWQRLKRKGASGVDHVTAALYNKSFEDNVKRFVEGGSSGATTGHRV